MSCIWREILMNAPRFLSRSPLDLGPRLVALRTHRLKRRRQLDMLFHAVMAPCRQVVPVSGSSSLASAVPRLFWTWLERCALAGPFRGCLAIGRDNLL
jgi:hypothetical protein